MSSLVASKIIGKKIAKLRFMPIKEPTAAQRETTLAVASWDDDVSTRRESDDIHRLFCLATTASYYVLRFSAA